LANRHFLRKRPGFQRGKTKTLTEGNCPVWWKKSRETGEAHSMLKESPEEPLNFIFESKLS